MYRRDGSNTIDKVRLALDLKGKRCIAIVHEIGRPRSSVNTALIRLRKEGVVEKDGFGVTARWRWRRSWKYDPDIPNLQTQLLR